SEPVAGLSAPCLDLSGLARVIAVRRLQQHVRAKLSRAGHKQVAVSLPAFLLQSVHRKTNERFGARPDAFRGRTAPRNNKTCDQADHAGSDDQKYSEFHCNLWRLWLGAACASNFGGTFSATTLINGTRSRTKTRHLILPPIIAGGARRSQPEWSELSHWKDALASHYLRACSELVVPRDYRLIPSAREQ